MIEGILPLAISAIGVGYAVLLLRNYNRRDTLVFGILVLLDAAITAWRGINVLGGESVISEGVLVPCGIGTVFLGAITYEFLIAFPGHRAMRWRWRVWLIAWAIVALALSSTALDGPWGKRTAMELVYFIPMSLGMLLLSIRAWRRTTRRDERIVIGVLGFRWAVGFTAYTVAPLIGGFEQFVWIETTCATMIGFVVIGTTVLHTELFSRRQTLSEVMAIGTLVLVVILGAGVAVGAALTHIEPGHGQALALFGATFVPLGLTALGIKLYPRVERRVLAPLDERRAARLSVQGEPIPGERDAAIAEATARIAQFGGSTVRWVSAKELPSDLATAPTALCVPAHGADKDLVGAFFIDGGTIDRDTFLVARDLAARVALSVERQQAVQELQEAKRLAALGQFAAAIAHDIRTPLTSISLNVQILRRKLQLVPDDAEHLDIALEELARLDRSVAEILDFAKPVRIASEQIDVAELIEDAVKGLSPVLSERGVQLVCTPGGVLTVHGDPQRLRQVLTNLVGNAADASQRGAKVELRATAASDGQIAIEVEDHGRGIGADDLPRIFEPFFTTRPDGTGLGLAICHKVVRAHGGDIRVRSTVGSGSTFTVVLPAA